MTAFRVDYDFVEENFPFFTWLVFKEINGF